MSVLRSIESKLESLFEGVFGRAFRTNVQPVELARKLAKEMDDHRNVSVSRVYVPNEYTVYLSPGDREQFKDYEAELGEELTDYLAEHARRENYALVTPPVVKIETDDDLGVGVFGIATRMVQTGKRLSEEPVGDELPGATMVYKPVVDLAPPPAEVVAAPLEAAYVAWEGKRKTLERERSVIGRSKDCDIQVSDPNVSRRHAEVRREGADYFVVDLDSTNGVEIRGKRVRRHKLEPGTRFTVGSTELTFGRESG